MANIMSIIGKIAAAEKEAEGMTFVAPCLEKGIVRIRISGIVKTLWPPRDFQGWGRFQYTGSRRARLEGEAMPYERDEYLSRLPSMSFRLAFFVEDGTWLAFPANRGVANAMAGRCEPTLIRLVDGGSRFDTVIASFDGATWWYREPDLRFSPIAAETLNREAEAKTDPDKVHYKGMTPEDRAAYDVALNPVRVDGMPNIPITDEDMLRRSLERGGGRLLSFTDREDRWIVEWETASGQRHSSAVSKTHMTVISAGICLSGMDKDFDLLSLVGVVEGRDRDYYDDDDW